MNRNNLIRLFITALFVISLILPFIPVPVHADGAWYSTNWSYRKTITVNGTVAGSQTNFQIPVIVEYGSGTDTAVTFDGYSTYRIYLNNKAQTDFDDVIFTNSVNTKLDHWLESYTASTNATIWVEYDSIPIAPNQATFNIYYGNASATCSSNGTATFVTFDDFERGVNGDVIAGAWTADAPPATQISTDHNYTAITSAGTAGTRSAKLAGSAGTNDMTIPIDSTQNYKVRYKLWKETAAAFQPYSIGNGTYRFTGSVNSTEDVLYTNAAGGAIDTGLNIVPDSWVVFSIYNINWSLNTYIIYAHNGTFNVPQMQTIVYDVDVFHIADLASGAGNDSYIDNYSVMKYCTPYPVITSIGIETGLGTLPQIQDIKIFEGFKSTGDWLIAVRYLNTYTPYYDTYDVRQYFVIRLLNLAGTEIARTSLPAWGNKVGCIYLSANQVTALNWGSAYSIQIYGTFTGNPYTQYTLTADDWIGVDLTRLDSWVITSAGVIGTYYSDILTANISTRGEVLNTDGASIFNTGIPGLMLVRPNLFQISTSGGAGSTTTFTQANKSDAWQTMVGPDATALLTDMGSFINIDGRTIGLILCILLMIILAGFGLSPNHTMASNALTIPILAVSIVLLFIDQALIAAIILVASLVVIWQLILNKGA